MEALELLHPPLRAQLLRTRRSGRCSASIYASQHVVGGGCSNVVAVSDPRRVVTPQRTLGRRALGVRQGVIQQGVDLGVGEPVMASPTISAALVAPARTGSAEQAQSSALVRASSAARTSGLGLVLFVAIAQPSRAARP